MGNIMEKTKRPSANNTRERILEAAKTLFLEDGFNGVSIQDIASEAQVNTNLIFHHYENKENLWLKVKDFILETCNEPPCYDNTSAKAYLKSIIDYRFELYSRNPDIARLLKWQHLSENQEDLTGNDFASPLNWKKEIIRFQRLGEIDSSINYKLIMLFIIYSTHAPFMQNVFPLSKARQEQYKQIVLSACISQFILQ